ncbi:MAG TPA: Smr/MutS family protein [Anaeromyxobacteraceae bacterium]|nr:Smr/MutS family protein [Anaeromyxobacteraceae bacterium]
MEALPDDPPFPEPLEFPIDGTLDLHAFRPTEVKDLVPEWLEACRARGLYEVRIIHGKGQGVLRRTVQALLARNPSVVDFSSAGEGAGGWGATRATLRKGDGG